MAKISISAGKMLLLGGVAAVAAAIAPMSAQAVPYAFASNNITNLTLTTTGGPITPAGTAITQISSQASYGALSVSLPTTTGEVGTALTAPASCVGGNACGIPDNTFAPGVGLTAGARADASIGGGTLAGGGVSVQNVAEVTGPTAGNATGSNSAAINFQVVGTGTRVVLSLTDTIRLIASTANVPGESANVSVSNTFSISPVTGGSTERFAPETINRNLSSVGGVPGLNDSGSLTFNETFTSGILTAGLLYNISLISIATANTTIGTPVPEPMSLALFGMGLAGLGLVRRRRNNA